MIWESLRPCTLRTRVPRRAPKLFLVATLASACLPWPFGASFGQAAELVADLEPGGGLRSSGSEPFDFHTLGSRVLFFTGDVDDPGELWVTKGTPATTRSLARAVGPAIGRAGELLYFSSPQGLGTLDLFDLWRTDGTTAGTFPIFEGIGAPNDWYAPAVALGDSLIFATFEGLWRTDGTTQATELLGTPFFEVERFLPFGETSALAVTDVDLWQTDGSSPGTQQVFATGDGSIEAVEVSGSRAFFVTDEIFGQALLRQLWVIDSPGTAPREVALPPDLQLLGITLIPGEPGTILFTASDPTFDGELWQTDGTGNGTRRLSDLPLGHGVAGVWYDEGTAWVLSRGGPPEGDTFWRIDGSPETQVEVFPDCDGAGCDEIEGPVLRFGDHFLIGGPRGASPEGNWITGGAPGDLRPLQDLCETRCSATDFPSLAAEDRAFFFGQGAGASPRLFLTDGSEAGTHLLVSPAQELSGVLSGAALLPSGEWVLGLGVPEKGLEPWVVSEEPAEASLLQDIGRDPPGVELRNLTSAGGALAFTSSPFSSTGEGFEDAYRLSAEGAPLRLSQLGETSEVRLERVEGTTYLTESRPGETHRLWALGEGPSDATVLASLQTFPTALVSWQGRTLFTVPRGSDLGLWEAADTAAGTRRVYDPAGEDITRFSNLTTAEDGLYFLTKRADESATLWRTDGTEAGTVIVSEVGPDHFSFDARLGKSTSFEGSTYFLICEDFFQTLWKVGPGPDDFTPLREASPCPPGGQPSTVLPIGSKLVYLSGGRGLQAGAWALDPATGQAVLLATSPFYDELVPESVLLGNRPLFTFSQPETGLELWTTDGTVAGTSPLRDIAPSFASSAPRDLTPAGDVVYFAARTQAHGRELWVTDGTEAGTRLAHDVNPGAQSSSPEELTVVGDKLYFTADDGLTGRELWVLPLDGGPPCQASEEALCLQDDRFRVEARWRNFRDEEGSGQAVELTQDTGYFWFFNEENVEAVLKVLDGRTNNDHFWSFYGALSNVEYWLTVTDTETGLTRRYYNPLRNFASVGDTFSFGPQGASLRSSPDLLEASPSPLPEVILSQAAPGTAGACAPSSESLCVNGGRFAVEVSWEKPNGETGTGKAVDLTDDTGYFWFFRDTNVELILKVLDGTANNGNYWVFYGSLSNVDFDVTVTDTLTGEVRTYLNRGREFASVGDTEAFTGL